MEEKSSSKSAIVTFIIILLVVMIALLGIAVYLMYQNNQELKATIKNQTNTVSNTVAVDDTTDEPVEILSTSNEIVSKLYDYVLKSDDSDESYAWESNAEPASFYRSNKVTYSSLTDMEKTLVVIKNYSGNELKTVKTSTLSGIVDTTDKLEDTIVYENINTKANQIFNQTETTWKNYEGLGTKLEYKNGNYYKLSIYGGGKGTSEHGYSELVKAEKSGDEIYIYDKFIYVDYTSIDIGETNPKIHIYTTADKGDDISTETATEFSDNVKPAKLFTKYESKLNTFKHTFKQAQDGTYYWVSTEISND